MCFIFNVVAKVTIYYISKSMHMNNISIDKH